MYPFKILQVIRPADGGMKKHLLSLVKGIDKKRFQIEVACLRGTSIHQEMTAAGIPVYDIPLDGPINLKVDLKCVKRIKELCKNNGYHIVHCHGSKAGMVGRLAAFQASIPALLTAHNFVVDENYGFFKKTVFTKGEQFFGKKTSHIITVSEALKQDYLEKFKTQPERVTCIYNGINTDIYEEDIDLNMVKKKMDIMPKVPVIGAVARMAPQKGLKYFLEAINYIKDKVNAQFLIAGDGPLYGELTQKAEELGITKYVKFLGYWEDIIEVIKIIDIFIIPSISEGLSITAIEAMAAGKPIIASRVGGLPEVVQHNKTGILISPGDSKKLASAILEVVDSKDLMTHMGREGKQVAREKFSLDKMITETQNVYTRLVGL